MKVGIDYVRVREIDEFDQCHDERVRVKDADGRLMIDRIIRIFSQHPKECVFYDRSLENEVYHDYREQLSKGLAITVAQHDEQVTKEFFDAVYGANRDAENPYLTFAKSQVSASTDALSGNEYPSEETIQLQQKMANIMTKSDGFTLINQALRARRRLCNFNKRYRELVC